MKNNQNLSRFELESQGHIAFANYRLEKNIIFIDYVFAPEELRGTGIAGKLMEEICVFAREKNLRIKPICGYAVVWLKKHKEHHDLVEEV